MLTTTLPRRGTFSNLSPHGFHEVVYHEWGDPAARDVVVCVHGLTRNGRDFDVLGEALASTHRVFAVDLPGRGESAWLGDPADYVFPTYLSTLTALLARTGAERVGWVGTSLGGLLGMVMAAQPNTPVAKLVVNDVGPAIEPAALARIGAYVGADPQFASYDEVAAYIQSISPFGPQTPEQCDHLTRSCVRQRPDGRWGFAYDPGIAVPFRASAAPPDLWGLWDAIACPTLLLRGAASDLLTAATARAMTERGPRPRLVEFAGVGHAPMLLSPDQVAPVLAFLRA
jgi:pimeloyl-ACP methyl ester carboxylesterase